MAEEKKKGGFWASLFGRNKKQETPQQEVVNESIIDEPQAPQIEEPQVSQIDESQVPQIEEPAIEEISQPIENTAESAVESDGVLVSVEETIESQAIEVAKEPVFDEKTPAISTALEAEITEIEPVIETPSEAFDAPLAEIDAEMVEEVKAELEPQFETREKPSEGGFFSRLVKGLLKTKQSIGAGFRSFFLGKKIDDELFEELEEQLLIADIGVPTTTKIIQNLTDHASRKQLQDAELLYQQLKVEMASILAPVAQPLEIDTTKKPYVILMVGVNGVGKTTTIGKLARKFQAEGKSVMLAAGDTFRAAAVEQLQVWGERNHIPVVAQSTGSDSASVIFDAMQSAAARNIDILIADTAGRLQNKNNLMDELKKIVRVMKKYDETAPHEIMLTLDAGTGQNAISQAKLFNEAVGLTGISLTKLDGTAKGGVIFAIADQFNLPIRYIGVGEKIEDLREFNAQEFIDALFVQEEE